MKETLIRTRGILTGGIRPLWIPGGALLVRAGRIRAVLRGTEVAPRTGSRIDLSDRIAFPGFVQTHLHLCQTGARGSADDLPLLEWLKDRILPYEASLTRTLLQKSVRQGLSELLRSGTTCILDMGTMRHTELIGEEMAASGIRGYFGKCLMDRNDLLPSFREETDRALNEARRLARRWHGHGDRLRWAFSPRFALTCSGVLQQQAHGLTRDFPGTLFHTHASEHLAELASIRKRFGDRNVEYLERLGVLSERSCLAHCVHLSDREMNLLAARGAKVLHCPSANLKLGSGVADVVRLRERGIPVSLGADGAACNNRLDPFGEMRLASLLQKATHGPTAMPAGETFRMATWDGAKALGWENEIGSLEEGKWADLVLAEVPDGASRHPPRTADDWFGALVYAGEPSWVTDVMVAGTWVVRNRRLRKW